MGYSVKPVLRFYIKTAAGWGKLTFITKQPRPRLETILMTEMLNVRIQFALFCFCQTFEHFLFFNPFALNFNVLARCIVPISRGRLVQLFSQYIIPESIYRSCYSGYRT